MSVRFLFHNDHRLSRYAIRTQVPAVGWLVIDGRDRSLGRMVARLVDEEGRDQLPWMESARLAASGPRGMLLRGVQHRKKGAKHSHCDQQAWWCQAPPVVRPLLDRGAVLRAAETMCRQQADAGWGPG